LDDYDTNSSLFHDVVAGAPADAVFALAVVDSLIQPGAAKALIGHDVLLMINLRSTPLSAPELGIDLEGTETDFLVDLLAGGFANDPMFGGAGPANLLSLPGYAVYAVTIPDMNGATVNASTDQVQIQGLMLEVDDVAYALSQEHMPGDFNQNGVVDAADYTVWRDTLSSTTNLVADGNGNDTIDVGDYGVWRQNFGRTSGSGSFTMAKIAVPEPASVLILLFGLQVLCVRRYAVVL
jgi:hypothetical protein